MRRPARRTRCRWHRASRRAGQLGAPIGYLLYRTYLPTGGNDTVALPTVTLVENGNRVTLPRCPKATGRLAASATSAEAVRQAARALAQRLGVTREDVARAALKANRQEAAGRLQRHRAVPPIGLPAGDAVLPRDGVDDQRLLPQRGQRLRLGPVSTAARERWSSSADKAATVPAGTSPVPWPQASLQLRYWSLCNNIYRKPWPVVANPEPGGGVDYGCAYDDETTLDSDGNYAYVVAPEGKQAAVEAAGGTFVPLSATQPKARQLLILRNMLPNDDFLYAVQDAPQNGDPASAAAAMGDYYPQCLPLHPGAVQRRRPSVRVTEATGLRSTAPRWAEMRSASEPTIGGTSASRWPPESRSCESGPLTTRRQTGSESQYPGWRSAAVKQVAPPSYGRGR